MFATSSVWIRVFNLPAVSLPWNTLFAVIPSSLPVVSLKFFTIASNASPLEPSMECHTSMVTSPAAASAWVSPAPFVPAAAVVSAGFVLPQPAKRPPAIAAANTTLTCFFISLFLSFIFVYYLQTRASHSTACSRRLFAHFTLLLRLPSFRIRSVSGM